MFELVQFYDYCKENKVRIIPFRGIPQPGATVRDGDRYAFFLDFDQIRSTRLLRGVCCHEMSHVATGALHRAAGPFESVERSEYRANRYLAQNFLTEWAFRQAFREGYTEPWQLAEYFDMPQEDVQRALRYWVEARGVEFGAADS